jgi:hypothetical protein
MAGKYKRSIIGSIVKSKDPNKPPYMKINGSHTLKDGQYLNLENKDFQLSSLDEALKAGRMSPETVAEAKARIGNIPSFVLYHVVSVSKDE